MIASPSNGLQRLAVSRREDLVILHDLGVPENCVHRGADFMGHIGEENGLRLIRALCLLFCRLQRLFRRLPSRNVSDNANKAPMVSVSCLTYRKLQGEFYF